MWTNWPQSHVGAYLPWLLWAAEHLTQTQPVFLLNYFIGHLLNAFAGFPALTSWGVALMLLWLVLRSRTEFRGREDSRLLLLLLGLWSSAPD